MQRPCVCPDGLGPLHLLWFASPDRKNGPRACHLNCTAEVRVTDLVLDLCVDAEGKICPGRITVEVSLSYVVIRSDVLHCMICQHPFEKLSWFSWFVLANPSSVWMS